MCRVRIRMELKGDEQTLSEMYPWVLCKMAWRYWSKWYCISQYNHSFLGI